MHRGYQGSFSLGVPIFLNVDKNVVRPGADLNFFGGFDIGYAVFGLALGAMWTPINFYNIPEAPAGSGYEPSPMTRLYLHRSFGSGAEQHADPCRISASPSTRTGGA